MDHVARNPVRKFEVECDYSTPNRQAVGAALVQPPLTILPCPMPLTYFSLSVTHVNDHFPFVFMFPQTTTYFQPHAQRTNFLLATSDPYLCAQY